MTLKGGLVFQGLWAEGAGDVSVAMQRGRTASLPGALTGFVW